MCGRFTLHASPSEVAEVFGVETPPFEPRFNITPSEVVGVVLSSSEGARVFAATRWGLVPSWSKEPKAVPNARAETVATSPWFRAPFRQRRCLIPADGFYEWAGKRGKKQPYYYRLKGGGLFAFAGLWDHWQDLDTSALITTDTNPLVRKVHPRMPVLLGPEDFDLWLDPGADPAKPRRLLKPYPATRMEGFPVSTRVNRGDKEGADLIEPLDAAAGKG